MDVEQQNDQNEERIRHQLDMQYKKKMDEYVKQFQKEQEDADSQEGNRFMPGERTASVMVREKYRNKRKQQIADAQGTNDDDDDDYNGNQQVIQQLEDDLVKE